MFFRDFKAAQPLILTGLFAVLISCADPDSSPKAPDYEGDIPACQVVISDEVETKRQPAPAETGPRAQAQQPQLWQPGPFPTWNTTPRSTCPQDPVISAVGDEQDVAVFITYPAAESPTVTGDGRVAEGAWPLIVFAHANNDTECNIYRRYRSLHRHWASWGFIVASVDGTGLNCTRGSKENIERRSEGQLKAVALMKALNTEPGSRFFGHIATDKIVFAGHSRGGGASLISALAYDGVAGVIDLQGIDTTSYGFGSPPLDFPLLGITAGRDVDLDYPYVEPTEDQSSGPYLWVNINGGIHAWTADSVPIEPDDTPRISIEQQHQITQLFTTAFLAHFVGLPGLQPDTKVATERRAIDALFSPSGASTVHREISSKGVFHRWNRRLDASILIDDYDRLSPQTNRVGGENTCLDLLRCEEVFTYRPDESDITGIYAKPRSRLLQADKSGGQFRITLGSDGVSVPAGATLQARVRGPDSMDPAHFEVEILTPTGRWVAEGGPHIGPIGLENRFTQLVLPLDALGPDAPNDTILLTEIIISLRDGTLFIDDLRVVPPT